jgi:uncharacterized protein YggE
MNRNRAAVAFAALVVLFTLACNGGDTIIRGTGSLEGINVSGTGRAFGVPDVALLQLGVEVQQPTIEGAREQAARAQQAIIDSAKTNGVAESDIRTEQFSIRPQYEFPEPARTRTISGYSVTNVVAVKVRDIAKTGKVLDDATRAGGNNVIVRNIAFTIDDPTELEKIARELAVQEARQRAEELAGHSGTNLGSVISVLEQTGRQVFPAAAAPVRAPATGDFSPTPIQAGELEVVVSVNLTYAIVD